MFDTGSTTAGCVIRVDLDQAIADMQLVAAEIRQALDAYHIANVKTEAAAVEILVVVGPTFAVTPALDNALRCVTRALRLLGLSGRMAYRQGASEWVALKSW